MRPVLRSFCYALILTFFAGAVSWAVALGGYRRPYYLAHMLPIFATLYLLLAWLIYLRRTALLTRAGDPVKATSVPRQSADPTEDRIEDTGILVPRDRDGLLQRRPLRGRGETGAFLQNTTSILLWSACQLAVLATILYHRFGVGSKYFTP